MLIFRRLPKPSFLVNAALNRSKRIAPYNLIRCKNAGNLGSFRRLS